MARFLKLERIEIQGFKSFYGRTLFDFPAGITAVVGPNGCGKSNIGDAISWVLGEQKASSLRSDRMEDVIFNGSEGRRPLGMAEVSLRFGNLRVGSGEEEGNGAGGNGRPAAEQGEEGNGHAVTVVPEEGEGGMLAAVVTDAPQGDDRTVDIPMVEEASSGGDDTAQESGSDERPGGRFFLEDLTEEVVVTRRLYRSGESEYSLNGQRCRLKDIQDLLSRTEIGTRLYSTIEQGKIDQILSAKPKDRRAIIEEAAGILGYKIKRRQSEVKLEAAQANLLRISDIASEVEKQINSLRRQAGKARRYRRLQESLRERRTVLAYRRLLAIDEERNATRSAIESLQTSEAAAAADLARLEAEVEILRRKLEEEEEASRGRRDQIHAHDKEIDRLQGRRQAGEEQAHDLQQRIVEARREVEELRSRLTDFERRCEQLAASIVEQQEHVRQAEVDLAAVEDRRAAQATEIGERESGLDRTRADLMRHLDEVSAMQGRQAALQEQIRSARATLQRLEKEAVECASAGEQAMLALQELENTGRATQSRIEEGTLRRQTLLADEVAASERLAELERRTEERKGRAATLAERLAELRELERQHAGYATGVSELLRGAAGFSPLGVVGERINVPLGLDRAVAAALGELCEAVLIADPGEANRGIAHLRQGAAGRVSFVRETAQDAMQAPALPADLGARPGVAGLLRDRIGGLPVGGPVAVALSRAVLVERFDEAIALHAGWPEWDFVSMEGDIVRRDGVITGGEGPELHHGVLARRAELDDVERRVEEVQRAADSAEEQLVDLRRDVAVRRAALEEATVALQSEEQQRFQGDLMVQQKKAELERLQRTGPLLQSERERIERDVASFESEAAGIGGGLEAAERRRQELDAAIRVASDDLAARRQVLESVQKEAGESQAALAGGQQRLEALGREAQSLDEAAHDTARRRDAGESECSSWDERIKTLEAQEIELKQAHDSALTLRAEAAAQEEAAMAALAYDRSLLHAREQSAREGRAAHEARREELQQRELSLARVSSDFDHLVDGCREDLDTTPAALRQSPPEFDPERRLEDDAAEVAEIKASLESIGPVNLMAIEQCSELEERHSFLAEQRKDLDEATASLRETIRRINRESRQRFLTAFEAVQAGFLECFTTLFGGGHAELRLQDDAEDVLETGIEIAAQPPGKKLQSLSLLSGGEKALTAVALLFSLFRYRPSPFCVLDEVDAPLDEANVERFTRMLQQLTDETQFILITHNRKSMEAADLLYGITMEEPGVSKVLPLKFE
jgi:chromosome segregation protein